MTQAAAAKSAEDVARVPKIRPRDLSGSWRVFTIAACPVEEQTPFGLKKDFALTSLETG